VERLNGTSTDIYSLGATLRRLLDVRPSSVFPKDLPLNSAKKSLRVEPERSAYASAQAFADDVRAFPRKQGPYAHAAVVPGYRARKFLRRYWLPVATAMLAIVALSTGLGVANRERSIAEQRFLQVRQMAGKMFDLDREIRRHSGHYQGPGN